MPTITATPDNVKSQVRLDLDFSDICAPYALVQRVDPITGAPTTVRGHGGSVTLNGVAYVPLYAGYKGVLYDTELPLDSNFYYTATAPSATLNVNPDFEGGFTDPWYAASAGITIRDTTSAGGDDFLSFLTGGGVASPTIRGEDIPANPGATFAITVNAFISAANGVTIGLDFLDTTGAVISAASTGFGAPLTLTTLSTSGVAPASTVAVRPFLQMQGTPGSGVTFSVSSVVVFNASGSATSGAAQVKSLGSCQFKDPLIPGNNVRVDFAWDPNPLCAPTEGVFWQSLDTEQYAANAAVFNVNNQDVAQVVSKRRSAPTSTLTLVSRTFADRDRLVTLLASGSALLFQAPDEYGLPDRYISVGANSISRVLPDHRIPIRVFSMPHTVCAAPGGPMQGTVGARWGDLCNRYASWAAVNAAGLTWIQLLDGLAG